MFDTNADEYRAAKLDPDARSFLETAVDLDAPDIITLPLEQARTALEDLYTPDIEPMAIASMTEQTIQAPACDIRVRIYDPTPNKALPAVVYFHGGGWIAGDLESHDSVARSLATSGNCVVVAVDYRKAPEHPFPAAIEDAYTVTKWVADNATEIGSGDGLAVAGDSAGGTLAAVVSQMAAEKTIAAPQIDYQMLFYPATNYAFDTASYKENADGFALTARAMVWFWTQYLRDSIDGANPYASPLRARKSVLSKLPPASIFTCGFDPLRDEGIAYVQALKNEGVPVEHTNYDNMIHDFLNLRRLDDPFPDIKAADDALKCAGDELQTAFSCN
jgi:acetyl esterase